ncbi:lactate/malate family dehydrogenase [Proteiniclasticum ruminis]|uniref:lactate/malate family dehydrogenase n=1 Tax=Proteiniclasticum ruminis TaxID=398199 RepID=UPI0028A7824A|nr:lactate dehydrogenase [Proteiniclasticum ruminis]
MFKKAELMAVLALHMSAAEMEKSTFLQLLPETLLKETEEILQDSHKINHLAEILSATLQEKKPVFMILENEKSPGRLIASTLEELLETDTADLIIKGSTSLPFPVYLLKENDRNFMEELMKKEKPFTVSILGLGDVGGTLLMGLRLLGRDVLKEIRIFDLDEKKKRRYYLEINEVSDGTELPPVKEVGIDKVFDTDVLIFTVSVYIPPLDTTLQDVRLVQFDKNRKILLSYAKQAEQSGFKGYYFIVSDPVDLLCMNLMEEGGIESHRIRGFGLGVMEARARFIASEKGLLKEDLRTYGPHGRGLIVVNSLKSYDEEISKELTHLTERENFRVRETGFKPYIAPALSSGAISIVKALKCDEHLSTFYNGKVFMGARNRLIGSFTLTEKVSFEPLRPLLKETEELLLSFYEKKGSIE